MIEIKINSPGAGEWIMKHAGGTFVPGYGQVLATYKNDELLGGFVLSDYTTNCMVVNMAGKSPGWATVDLLWMLFDYAFNQMKVKKLLAMVSSDNSASMSQCLRAGWQVETLIKDLYGDNVHGFILAMTPDACVWLSYTPKTWRRNYLTVVSDTSHRDAA